MGKRCVEISTFNYRAAISPLGELPTLPLIYSESPYLQKYNNIFAVAPVTAGLTARPEAGNGKSK